MFRTSSEATETNVDKLNQPKETEKNTTFPHQFVFETEKKKKSLKNITYFRINSKLCPFFFRFGLFRLVLGCFVTPRLAVSILKRNSHSKSLVWVVPKLVFGSSQGYVETKLVSEDNLDTNIFSRAHSKMKDDDKLKLISK